MAKNTDNFDRLWTSELEGKAKGLGVIDGDLSHVRVSVKNALISADWAKNDGSLLFSSENDRKNAIKAAVDVLTTTSQRIAVERKVVVRAAAGTSPTKSQVLLASAVSAAPMSFSSVSPIRNGAFAPEMAKPGDKCPRCNSTMEPVGLVNERAALYCSRDRVVEPLSADSSVRT